ncbi:hypothetical protein XA68_12495 [Ophiocordyceps unilateralis]|uniref:Uncharacterized protein n=1 Tax=Ophiocordyceps unilateralis TaxID=268505 RepID=A0A2A9PEL6_OPHUN|nr:hypothetical protein XA68_12495 [Ophiocordyceps unilateralis]
MAPTPTPEDMAGCLEVEAEKIENGEYEKVTGLELVKEYVRLYDTLDEFQKKDQTQIAWAVANNHEFIVRLLLKSTKVNPNDRDAAGRTALSRLAGNGHVYMAKLLLQSPKVGVTIPDKQGRTPLLWAAAKGRLEIVQLLLMAEAKPHVADKKGRTPFLIAAANGRRRVVSLLLSLTTVDANVVDNEGRTAVLWAQQSGHAGIVKLLDPTGNVTSVHHRISSALEAVRQG